MENITPVEVVNLGGKLYCSMNDIEDAIDAVRSFCKNHDQDCGIQIAIDVISHVKLSYNVAMN